MSKKKQWKPDDSLLERERGQLKGARRVTTLLSGRKLTGDRVITSQDPQVKAIQAELGYSENMPPGFIQWQLPTVLGRDQDVLFFSTIAAPNAVLPQHNHPEASLFRIVLQGSILVGNQVLNVGDWMYVPEGVDYGYTAGPEGAYTHHPYKPSGPSR